MILKIYLQGSSGESDIENRLMDIGRAKERVRCMERVTWKLTLPYAKCVFPFLTYFTLYNRL